MCVSRMLSTCYKNLSLRGREDRSACFVKYSDTISRILQKKTLISCDIFNNHNNIQENIAMFVSYVKCVGILYTFYRRPPKSSESRLATETKAEFTQGK